MVVPPGTAVYDDGTGELLADLVERAAGDGRARRSWRPRQHALHDRPPTRPRSTPRRASPARSAGSGSSSGSSPTSASSACRTPASRPSSRPLTAAPPEDRRLPVHDPRAEPRRPRPRRRGRAPPDDRRRARAHRGRQPGRRPRPCVPAPRRADPGPRPRRRRLGSRSRVGPRGHPRRARGARSGAARQTDARRLQQDRPARGRRGAGPPSGRPAQRDGLPCVAISAASGDGLAGAAGRARRRSCPTAEELDQPAEPAGIVVHRIESLADGFLVEREADGAFRVRGKRIERIAAQTDFEVEESAERFQRDLARLGIDAELRRAGSSPATPSGSARSSSSGSREAWEVAMTDAVGRRAGRSGSSAGRSTRSTSAISRSPTPPATSSGSTSPVRAGRRPPTSPGGRSARPRIALAMVALAIADNPGFAVSRAELDRDRALVYGRHARGAASRTPAPPGRPLDLTFILSAEAFAGLPAWHGPERVLELARMAVVPRPGAPVAGPRGAGCPGPRSARSDRVHRRPAPAVSASAIRAAGRRGPVDPVPRPGCGHRLHRRPWPVRRARRRSMTDQPRGSRRRDRPRQLARQADPCKTSRAKPAGARRGLDCPPATPPSRATAGPRDGCRPADRRAGRGQEGGRHRAARSRPG